MLVIRSGLSAGEKLTLIRSSDMEGGRMSARRKAKIVESSPPENRQIRASQSLLNGIFLTLFETASLSTLSSYCKGGSQGTSSGLTENLWLEGATCP